MDNLFIARQPIYNREKGVIGYELLYRNDDINQANITDADLASCETILNSFMHIGIDNIVGSALAFINLPREFIVNEQLTPMFREQAVLEILEDIDVDESIIPGIQRLKSAGYQIALDDFVYDASHKPLVELADYIKIDVLAMDRSEIEQLVYTLKTCSAQLIAEKVESYEMFEFCYDLGFDLFQGYFFCRPEMLKQKSLPSNKLVILDLLGKLQDPDISPEKLETILVQDITLSYKLLRYINSAAFGLRREIDSIKDAIVLLGIDNLKNWISLILMSKVVETKPTELIITGMIRGKMCELLAEQYFPKVKPQMFIIGLFSVLDALMDQPLIELLDTVILSTEIKMALLDKTGIQGEIYQYVLQYEQCNWDDLNHSQMDTEKYIQSYLTAVFWADQSMRGLFKD